MTPTPMSTRAAALRTALPLALGVVGAVLAWGHLTADANTCADGLCTMVLNDRPPDAMAAAIAAAVGIVVALLARAVASAALRERAR